MSTLVSADFRDDSPRQEPRIRSELILSYMQLDQSQSDAMEHAESILLAARKRAITHEWHLHDSGHGDLLIVQATTNSELQQYVKHLKAEGGTIEDFRWWWNLCAIERAVTLESDDGAKLSMFLHYLSSGITPEEAATKVKQAHPYFGYPTANPTPDSNLPYELKNRIVGFIEHSSMTDPLYLDRIESCSSFNALVRLAIREGRL